MSEQAPTVEPDARVDDVVKAAHMAYAEQPFRDDAHTLGEMATRASRAGETEQVDHLDDIEMDLGTPSERHARSLQAAQEAAIASAQAAGEKQGQAYDHAQSLRQQADDAEKALN
jgi:hypothetical protein